MASEIPSSCFKKPLVHNKIPSNHAPIPSETEPIALLASAIPLDYKITEVLAMLIEVGAGRDPSLRCLKHYRK